MLCNNWVIGRYAVANKEPQLTIATGDTFTQRDYRRVTDTPLCETITVLTTHDKPCENACLLFNLNDVTINDKIYGVLRKKKLLLPLHVDTEALACLQE